MESKKINQLATELAPDLSDLTIIGDPTTGISKKITLSQMASLFTGTVEEYANFAAFPLVGVADTIYIAKDTNVIYRWDSTAYVVLSPNIIASLVFNDANGFDGTISLVGSVATLTITTALTSGSVPFIGASGALTQDNANLFFDDTNNRLGIATASPTTALDVFGSGIIGRLNATSTNNSFLGFASNGTNKWSAGNVQSDHRFRIFSEANSAELITILQTGEFGIGITNPTTKFHIDGAASALIANLDANVSVSKSISFRSDNSNRINLEVSGTESGSNAGANFFIRRYSDAGSLIDTPLTITRSTGAISLATALSGTSASFSRTLTGTNASFVGTGDFSSGALTLTLGADNNLTTRTNATQKIAKIVSYNYTNANNPVGMLVANNDGTDNALWIGGGSSAVIAATQLVFFTAANNNTATGTSRLTIASTGAATFSGQINADNSGAQIKIGGTGIITEGAVAISGSSLYLTDFATYTKGLILNLSTGAATFSSTADATIFNSTSNAFRFSGNNALSLVTLNSQSVVKINAAGYWGVQLVGANDQGILINNTGNIGIGTSSPAEKLHVEGIIRATSSTTGINLHPNADFGAGSLPTIQVYTNHALQFATNNSLRMSITSGGTVCIGTSSDSFGARLLVTGSTTQYNLFSMQDTGVAQAGVYYIAFWNSAGALAGGVQHTTASTVTYYTGPSDQRLKSNIKDVQESVLPLFNEVKLKTYNHIADEDESIIYKGFLAQDMVNNFPEAYGKDKDGYYSFNPSGYIPYLVKAIQELKAEIDILKAK